MAIILPILSTFNAAGIKAAQGQLAGFGKSLKGLVGPAAAATLGIQALQGAVQFAGDAISEARDLERNMAALGTVFGNLEPRMKAFVDNAYNMGLSQVDAARTSTFLGSVLKQAGLPMDQVAQKTEELTILAQDLATTYGYDTSEALTAMTALFRGEYDPIEKFGVALKQNEVNALVAAKGLSHLTGQEMLNAQQTVRMEQLFLRSADAAGAFARQSGTLFVEQKKLTAVFSNMQAAVGSQLTPALAGLMQELTPIVEDLTPVLSQTFASVGTVIDTLSPIVGALGDIFVDLFDALTLVTDALAGISEGAAPYLIGVFDLLAETIDVLNTGLQQIGDFLGDLSGWAEDFNNSDVGKFFISWSESIVETNRGLSLVLDFMNRIKARGTEEQLYGLKQDSRQSLLDSRLENKQRRLGLGEWADKGKTGTTGSKKAVKDSVAEFYKDLKDEMEKQSARLKLEKMGASKAFIETVIGSGEDWKKVFANVAARGKAGVAQLQREFNKTAAGIKEIADANEAAIKASQDAYDEALKAYDKLKDAYDEQVQAINDLKKSLKDAASAVSPLAVATREIGLFEQAVIDSFDNVAQAISQGVADGTLLKDAAQELTDYARKEQVVIQDLMRQRDELVNRRNLAKALMDDVKSTIVGMGNITELLAKNTTDVTQTITKMVGNVQVATSKVIKGANGGAAGLVASFTETLNKTKEFAKQLKDLRALGLDKNLYQQIVTAGIDAGGATAKAILEGGTGTVSELNGLFAELDSVGADIAEQSGQVMYGAGIDLVDGLINGMISKEKSLVEYAQKLADTFTNAFAEKMNLALPMPTAPVAPTMGSVNLTVGAAELDTFALARQLAGNASDYYSGSESIRFANIAQKQNAPINITVNAGLGTDGKIVGQTIQSYINQYNKSNVF